MVTHKTHRPCLSTLTVVVLLLGYHTSTSGALTAGSDVVVPAPATPGAATPSAGATGGTSSTGSSGTTQKKSSGTAAKTVTGPLVQTRWDPCR